MSSAADRKNQLVWDQIESGQFKQALQLINKRLKKGEKSEYLISLKAFVCAHIDTIASNEEAEQLARSVCEKQPPVSAPEVLRLLSRVWMALNTPRPEEITKIWEKAVKAQPQNEDLSKEWFWATLRAFDWAGAQKAAMSLQKTFTKRREYWFWAVAATLLLHNSLPEDSPSRKMFGTLAYRMIDKARNETPADSTLTPPRAVQNSQEVNLLLELLPYVAPGDASQEALAVLNSQNLGTDSKIGTGDWWGLTRKKLELLQSTKDWTSLYSVTKELLPKGDEVKEEPAQDGKAPLKTDAGRGDDWLVWSGFVESAGKLYDAGDKEVSKAALKTILDHWESPAGKASRNGDLALVKFSSLFHDKKDGPEGTPTLLEALEQYFDKIGTKVCCFEDIQTYAEMLEESEKQDFVKYIEGHLAKMSDADEKSKIEKVYAVINQQKFVYLFTISPLASPTEDAVNTIKEFISANLNTYAASLPLGAALLSTDNQYGDEAALLAVMGLIRLFTFSPTDQTPVYQAITVLETILLKSKHNYQALLILVRLYINLGAIELALTTYPRLNIKQVQNDTLSHFVLTRITTLLPSSPRVPFLLSEAGSIYDSSKHQAPNMLQLAFERGSYAQMFGFLDFSDRVAGSVCRSMWEVELRRLVRLTSFPDLGPMSEVGHKGSIWDNRDFSVILDCEQSTSTRFERTFRVGPTPGKSWVRAFAAAEATIAYLELFPGSEQTNGSLHQAVSLPPLPESATATINAALAAEAEAAADEKEFTTAEHAYLTLAASLASLILATQTKDGGTAATLLADITTTLLPACIAARPQQQDWSLLHHLGMAKDAVALAEITTKYLQAVKTLKPSLPKGAVKELSGKAKTLKEEIGALGMEAEKGVADEEETQKLVDAVLDMGEVGAGKVFQEGGVWGGVEGVAGRVKMVREVVARGFENV